MYASIRNRNCGLVSWPGERSNDFWNRTKITNHIVSNDIKEGHHYVLPDDVHKVVFAVRHKASGKYVAGVLAGRVRSGNHYICSDLLTNARERAKNSDPLHNWDREPPIAFEEMFYLTDDIIMAMYWDSRNSVRASMTSAQKNNHGLPDNYYDKDDVLNALKDNQNFEIVRVEFSKPVVHSVEVHGTGRGGKNTAP